MDNEQLTLTKLETAGRQLKTAISLFFNHEDPISIHTLTCAAYNVLVDVNKHRGGKSMFVKERYPSQPGSPDRNALNAPENFFKHADRDPDETHDFFPKMTEALLVDAVEKYKELSGATELCFLCFGFWYCCHDPELFAIPKDWARFVVDAKHLFDTNDRAGFYQRFMAEVAARELHE